MKRVTLIIHLESAQAQMVWWAETYNREDGADVQVVRAELIPG